ncbi:MAG TPA: alkaline phosphatase family protein [Gemmatimonadaceae bacterium]|nr:alkaline phosphatase family protein [Gemmatimonadaceae bacterium]
MTTSPTKLLVLGIDAASATLVEEWMADGTMPKLAALAKRGLTGRTRGVDGFFVGSTWPSLYTGTNPAQHGFHYQVQLASGSYSLEDRAAGAFVERDPFWRVLSRAGKRVAVLDVPLARIERDLNGVHVVEWGGHDSFFGYSTTPPALASEIESRFGRHPVGASCDAAQRSPQDYLEFKISLQEGVQRRARWSAELLERGGWDLFMTVFTESHCAGHQCWHLHDAEHPAHDPSVAAITGNPMRSVYRAIDEAIGKLIHAAGDATIVVFSAHGMSSRYGAYFLLRDLLYGLGVATPPPVSLRSRMREAVATLWRALPQAARRRLAPLRDRVTASDDVRASSPQIGVDFDRSHCFPLANGLAVGGIRLNLAGREPRGVLTPGEGADRFCAELEADLLAIVDEITGKPLVRRVIRTRDLFAGPRLDALPDLLVEWNDAIARGSTALGNGAASRVRARSPKFGTIEGMNEYGRSGEHRAGGWFVAAGPEVTVGRLNRDPSLLDLAPTFARILGVVLPGTEGSPIEEIVRS